MTFTVECAFRCTLTGVVFRLDNDPPENEMCELRVSFDFQKFHAPERDVGMDITWNCAWAIEFRALGESWRILPAWTAAAALIFLEKHHYERICEAEREAALETYYGS
jgi:hypothetical protein